MAYSNYYLSQRLSNLQYQVDQIVNPVTGYVPIEGNTNIKDIKIFIDEPPQTPHPPILPDDIVNKTYADSLFPTPINAVLIDGDQTLGTGIKTFINLPQSATVPIDNDDLVNKLYVDSHGGGGITINDVLTNTLPFTATQTFNNTIIANSLITGNITNSNNSINSTNATNVNITDVGAGSGVFPVLFSSTSSGNGQLKCDNANLKFNSGTDTLTCPNFNGLASSANTVALTNLTSNTGSFPLVLANVVSGNALEGVSINLLYTPSPNGLLQTGNIKTSSINTQTITSDTSALQINPLTNFIISPTAPNPTAGQQVMNYETTTYLIGINTPNFAYRNSLNTFTNNNNFTVYCPQTPITASVSNDLTNLSTVNSLISTASGNYAKLGSSNIFTALNQFTGQIPQCSTASGSVLTEIANVQTVNNLIAGGGVGGATLSANPQTFTGQNIFNGYCPQSPIAPTTNNSLVNLLYLQNQLNSYPKKANFYNIINAPTTNFFINISNPAPGGISDWGYNDFFTIRYKLSMTYPNVPIPNSNPNASFYTGYLDIYPIRIPSTLIIGTSQINVFNNSINGNTAYYIGTSQPTWAVNGRQMWAYNTFNSGVNPPPLYLMAVDNSVIPTISMKFILNNPNSNGANPPDPALNIFWCDFTIELLSWGSSSPQKITSTGFTTNF